ncbi:MAG: 2,3-diphosphoglycerate-dependent phosphoglycerate mutase [Gammaproteobacteria bacterium]|nr:2,3-diphosphoglycerate-dependent phosphoglycerate mutase [Gammaproteobacteria bacterium]
MQANLILVRHGQSTWNKQNLFTGWIDVDLSEQGVSEARQAGRDLAAAGIEIDIAFTSVLKRAIRTLWITLDEMDQMWVPVRRDWRLNERHYGALQGLNKAQTAAKYGDEQVLIWRRSYAVLPPELDAAEHTHPCHDRRYAHVERARLPGCESLATTLTRVLEYWELEIAPSITSGKTVLIAAHGNSLRALLKHLQGISEEEITQLNIPTGIPLLMQLDAALNVVAHEYLADPATVEAAARAVANQGKAE